jgi:hypothetical protein
MNQNGQCNGHGFDCPAGAVFELGVRQPVARLVAATRCFP